MIGGDCKISVFNYYLCFDVIWSILQFLCYVFLFACHWASVYVKADFLAWKRGRGQVFNTHCVQVFMPIVSRIFSYFCTLVASWKLGRIVSPRAAFPILIGRVNKWLESELVFDCDEVAAEMHISLVRYEQEMVFFTSLEHLATQVGFSPI